MNMDMVKENQQRQKFRDILFELAKKQDSLQESADRSSMYKRLEALYDAPTPEGRFRHFYSDIFSVLTEIQKNPELGDINILGQNLAVIRKGYKAINPSPDGDRIVDISDSIKKLYDHVSLDIARILYSDAADRKVSEEETIEGLQSAVTALTSEIERAKEVQSDVEKRMNNQQKEYIAILGIFAAVVLAFTGGITFSISVLENIAQASVYRMVLVPLVIGLVLVNVLFGLFYYIDGLVNRDEKTWPLLIANAVLIALILITVIAWNFGWVETRNKRIYAASTEQDITEIVPSGQSPEKSPGEEWGHRYQESP